MLDTIKIFPLSEGTFTIDASKVFQPFKVGVDNLYDRPKGSLLVEIQPFLIDTGTDLIVFDTGLGFTVPQFENAESAAGTETDVLQIHQNIINLGYKPELVTKVLLSHLHKDHAGAISFINSYGSLNFSFPHATYYVNQHEVDYAVEKSRLGGSGSYHKQQVQILEHPTPQIIYLPESGYIDDYIQYWQTGGHSKYHIVFLIHAKSQPQKIFFGADVAPQLGQMKKKYIAKYDEDGEKSMQLRQQWWQQGHEEGWTFLFYHDIKHPVYQAATN